MMTGVNKGTYSNCDWPNKQVCAETDIHGKDDISNNNTTQKETPLIIIMCQLHSYLKFQMKSDVQEGNLS